MQVLRKPVTFLKKQRLRICDRNCLQSRKVYWAMHTFFNTANHAKREYEIIIVNDRSTISPNTLSNNLVTASSQQSSLQEFNKHWLACPLNIESGIRSGLHSEVDSDDFINENFLTFLFVLIQGRFGCSCKRLLSH